MPLMKRHSYESGEDIDDYFFITKVPGKLAMYAAMSLSSLSEN
jgi:hypothetical protein